MTTDPRIDLRRRIVSRLSNDEWMNRHFGIACHAGDVADAVLELFDEPVVEESTVLAGITVPGRVAGCPVSTRLVLRTPAEEEP